MKGVLSAFGDRKTLIARDRQLGRKASINKLCYFSNLLPQAPTFNKLVTNWAPKSKFLYPIIPHQLIGFLSKKHKSYLLWPLLGSYFYETSVCSNLFLFLLLVCLMSILLLVQSQEHKRDRGGNSSLSTLSCYFHIKYQYNNTLFVMDKVTSFDLI